MNPALQSALGAFRMAADAALTGAAAEVPQLDAEALEYVEHVAEVYHAPPELVAFARGENARIGAAVDPKAVAAITFFKTRIDALLGA